MKIDEEVAAAFKSPVHKGALVSTPYGNGRLHDARPDGSRVVKFPFGIGYLNTKDVKALRRKSHEEFGLSGSWEDANDRAYYGVELFFNNKFKEAEEFFTSERDVYPVYALVQNTSCKKY